MTKQINDISFSQAAIISGISILIMAIAAVVATDLTAVNLIIADNAIDTTNNIRSSEVLFRISIFSWIIILICDILAAWGLYIYLKPVNKSLSLLVAWFRLIYAAILGTALLNYIDVLLLINNDTYLATFGVEKLQSHILLFLNAFNYKWSVGLIVFGIHILLLGYLVFKSGYIPKIFGILLIVAFFGYTINNLFKLLLPISENYISLIEMIFILPMVAGELGLGLWLLIKGVKVEFPGFS